MNMKAIDNYLNNVDKYELTERYCDEQKLINIGFKKVGKRFVMRKELYDNLLYVKFVVEPFADNNRFFTYYVVLPNGDLYTTYYSEYSGKDKIIRVIQKNLDKEVAILLNKGVITVDDNSLSQQDFKNHNICKIKKLNKNAKLPTYSTNYSAGADLHSVDKIFCIKPNETVFVHTGISMEIPSGYVGLIYARSGLSCKNDLAPANKVGVIDSDYRGEIIVALHNHGTEDRSIKQGERIAQIIIQPVMRFDFIEVDELSNTDRGNNGFGSTGR